MGIQNKFLSRVNISISTGCWEWVAGKCKKGYGTFWANGRTNKAHRFSYTIFNKEIPKGLFVLHKCDNPSCVNPEHLFTGTNQDNMDDMVRKGRSYRGSKRSSTRLTEDNVKVIRDMIRTTSKTCREIGLIFGVSKSVIKNISSRQTWRHV